MKKIHGCNKQEITGHLNATVELPDTTVQAAEVAQDKQKAVAKNEACQPDLALELNKKIFGETLQVPAFKRTVTGSTTNPPTAPSHDPETELNLSRAATHRRLPPLEDTEMPTNTIIVGTPRCDEIVSPLAINTAMFLEDTKAAAQACEDLVLGPPGCTKSPDDIL